MIEDFYKNSEDRILKQQIKIQLLQKDIERYKAYDELSRIIIPELKVLYPSVKSLSLARSIELTVDSLKEDTVTIALLKFAKQPTNDEKTKINNWLKARVGAEQVRLITQ